MAFWCILVASSYLFLAPCNLFFMANVSRFLPAPWVIWQNWSEQWRPYAAYRAFSRSRLRWSLASFFSRRRWSPSSWFSVLGAIGRGGGSWRFVSRRRWKRPITCETLYKHFCHVSAYFCDVSARFCHLNHHFHLSSTLHNFVKFCTLRILKVELSSGYQELQLQICFAQVTDVERICFRAPEWPFHTETYISMKDFRELQNFILRQMSIKGVMGIMEG